MGGKVERLIRYRRPAMRLAVLLAASALFLSCQAMPTVVKPRLEENGLLVVYLQPLSQEADRLSFRLTEVFAVREDGTKVPLSLHLGEILGKESRRDRILASGEVPPGPYQGFSFRVESATLQGEEGPSALSPSGENPVTSVRFQVARRKGQVVTLRFLYRESLPGGIRFSPLFSAEVPGRIALGLVGLVTSRGENTVTAFDKLTGRVIAVVPTGNSPAGMALHAASRRAYVAVSGRTPLRRSTCWAPT